MLVGVVHRQWRGFGCFGDVVADLGRHHDAIDRWTEAMAVFAELHVPEELELRAKLRDSQAGG